MESMRTIAMKPLSPISLRLFLAVGWALFCAAMQGQTVVVNSPDIGHVAVAVNGDEARLPVLTLNTADRLTISFDALTPEYQRFTWRVEHCTYDWQPTDGLFESEFMQGAPQDEPIEGYEESSLTATLYTHYAFHIGGTGRGVARPLVSGNYRVLVFGEENDESPAFTVCFMVTENSAKLAATVTADTDIDYRRAHQQLNVTAEVDALRVINPDNELRLVCMQNRSPYYTVTAPSPTYLLGTQAKWEHCRALIFPGGNEYRKFEMPSTRVPGMHMDRIRHDGEGYTALLLPDQPRGGYFFDEDQNGRCLVYTDRSDNAATEADYVLTHFTLQTEEIPNTDIIIDGRWTNSGEPCTMYYNPEAEAYEADILLKQGYYSYRYLCVEHTAAGTEIYNADGNYYQTENEYTTLLYHRPQGARYWRLTAVNNQIRL